MHTINHTIRLGTATLLAMVLGSYLAASSADGAELRDISRVNRGINVEHDDSVGDVSSVNGSIRVRHGASAREVSTVNGGIDLEHDAQVDSAETVNGGIRLGERVSVRGSLLTVNGGIRTGDGSVVDAGVRTVNGRVLLRNTTVGQDVQTSSGDIELRDGSAVEGDIVVKDSINWWNRLFNRTGRKPEISIDASSAVRGDIHLYREVELNIADGAEVGEIIEHY